MEWKLVHFYPELMSLYGSWANLAVLRRALEELGGSVTVLPVRPGEQAELSGAHFLYMGAGTEREQKVALADFARYGRAIKQAAGAGMPMLFAGSAMELLGETITAADGARYQGIGLAPFTAVQGKKRLVGDVYGRTGLYDAPVVGFMNKCSLISGVEQPLLTALEMGFGNEREKGPEGLQLGRVLASQLTGPILVKNPRLLDWVVNALYDYRAQPRPARLSRDSWGEKGYAVTEEQLRRRWEKG